MNSESRIYQFVEWFPTSSFCFCAKILYWDGWGENEEFLVAASRKPATNSVSVKYILKGHSYHNFTHRILIQR